MVKRYHTCFGSMDPQFDPGCPDKASWRNGRRKRLRTVYLKGCGGSSPPEATRFDKYFIFLVDCSTQHKPGGHMQYIAIPSTLTCSWFVSYTLTTTSYEEILWHSESGTTTT